MRSDHMATPERGVQGANVVGSQPGLSVHRINFFNNVAEMPVACAARPGTG